MLISSNAKKIVDDWNDRYLVGQSVVVKQDFHEKGTLTKTRSEAKVVCNDAVVWLEGISGCYSLSSVIPI